jgi:PEGA domain
MKLAATVLVLVSAMAAAEKPTLAVLGVVPLEPGTAPDPALVKASSTLDASLRRQIAKHYRVTGSVKQIRDARRTADCSIEENPCAAKLGAQLGADFALAGELHRRTSHFELKLAIVDVATKKRVRLMREKIPANANLAQVAKRAIDKLTGKGESGELVVIANVPRAEVYIDDELRGELFESRATITLPQGRYKLSVRAAGKKPFEDMVNVDQATQLNVLLDAAP